MKESRDAFEVEQGRERVLAVDQHHLVLPLVKLACRNPSSSPCSDRSELSSDLRNRQLATNQLAGRLLSGVLSRADTAAIVVMQVQPGSFEQ